MDMHAEILPPIFLPSSAPETKRASKKNSRRVKKVAQSEEDISSQNLLEALKAVKVEVTALRRKVKSLCPSQILSSTLRSNYKIKDQEDAHRHNLIESLRSLNIEVSAFNRIVDAPSSGQVLPKTRQSIPKINEILNSADLKILQMKIEALKATIPVAIHKKHGRLAALAARSVYNYEKKWLGQKDTNILQTIFFSTILLKNEEPDLCRQMLNFIGRNTRLTRTSKATDNLYRAAKENHDTLVNEMSTDEKARVPQGPWMRSKLMTARV